MLNDIEVQYFYNIVVRSIFVKLQIFIAYYYFFAYVNACVKTQYSTRVSLVSRTTITILSVPP